MATYKSLKNPSAARGANDGEIDAELLDMARRRRMPFMITLSLEERSLIATKARLAGMSVAGFIRAAALEKAQRIT